MLIKYKLGDVVKVRSERVDNPASCSYDKFVGLEHYVSGEIEIKKYGDTSLLKSAMKVFKSGDILVARRNVYLKRASIVKFDGITSGDSIVLHVENKLLRKIIPFVLNTDDFWEYAEKFSDGTMSKRLSPKVLLEYEFMLPEIDKLEKLAELLWAANNTKEAYKKLLNLTDELIKAQFIEMFGDPINNNKSWPVKNLGEIADCFIGLTYKPENVSEEGTLVLRSGNIQNSELYFEDNVRVNVEVKEKLLVKENDILMCSRNGSASLVGKVAMIPKLYEEMTFGAFMTIIRSKYYDYLFTYFQLPAFRTQILAGKTSTINQITKKILDGIILPVPPLEVIEPFSELIKQSRKSKLELKENINNLEKTIKALMAKNFG
ncbi:restriction endonuclease subunit S [Clostridium thermobutyricum]|nr:restriction endonuclease subunit S [Clostridium paraputrificum]